MPEHAELYLLLSMVVPVPWLERVPTYKEQQENLKDKDLSSIGFLGYPLLQTADVAMYDARFVPVGEDQVAHLELAREVVRRFNNFFGEAVLVEPQPLLTTFGRLPGLDGDKKMSKSLGNTIHLSDTPDEVKKKVMRMYTDPKRVRADIPGTVEGNPVFTYHDAFNPNTAEVDDLKARYRAGKVGDVEVKTKLANALNAHLAPIRERRAAVLAKPDRLREILFEGSKRARAVAAGDDGARAGRGEDLVPVNMSRQRTRGSQPHDSSRRPTPSRSSSSNFEGPLDLLLHLIRKNEVNIYDIPIALITAQYLDAIELMQELNLDVAGEFLVMAATLIHIKSKMLLPRPETAAGVEGERGGSARRAGAAAARAPEVQGGGRDCCTSASRCARRSGSGPTSASPRSPATTTSRSSKSISSAC